MQTNKNIDALVAQAQLRVALFRKEQNLTIDELTVEGMGKSQIHRILANQLKWPLDKWLGALGKLFNQINNVLATKGRMRVPWQEVFGDDFPEPVIRPDPTLSNYADISQNELRRLTRPLAEFLDAEYSVAFRQNNVWKASQLLNYLCKIHELAAEWGDAAHKLNILGELNAKTDDFHHVADAWLRQAIACFYDSLYNEAENCCRAGLNVIAQHSGRTPPPRTELRLLNYFAMARSKQGHLGEAREILETRCLPLAKDHGSAAAVASVWNRLGSVCLALNDVSCAFDYLVKAFASRTRLQMHSEAALTLSKLGVTHERKGELPQAIVAWKISVEMQKSLRDFARLSRAYYELGIAYSSLHRVMERTQQPKIVVEFNASNFYCGEEFEALTNFVGNTNPRPEIFRRGTLLSRADAALEAAICWDRGTNDHAFADLAKEARKVLRADERRQQNAMRNKVKNRTPK